MKQTHGGSRLGAGRKTVKELGIEKRKAFNIQLSPCVAKAFHKKHGRHWGRKVEEYMKKDLFGKLIAKD